MTQYAKLEDIMVAWQTDAKFREDFKKNPAKALAEAGFVVSPEDFKFIETALGEELDKRVNK